MLNKGGYKATPYCPKCQSKKVSVSEVFETVKFAKVFPVQCLDCNAFWKEVWEFRSLREIQTKEERDAALPKDWKKTRGCKQ